MHRLTPQERHAFAQTIAVVARRWRARLDERLRPLDMSIARWGALYWLGQDSDGLSQAALAERAGVEPPTLVRVIDQLEAQGLVERRASPTDRRVKLVRLTPAARPVVEAIEAEAEALRREMMGDLSYEEYQAASAVLHRLLEKLD